MDTELLFTVTANFTAEPIRPALRFWFDRLRLGPGRLEFSAYNSVFQELMLPQSALASSVPGVNFLLIRLEDWAREQHGYARAGAITAGVQEFVAAFPVFAQRIPRPTILLLCPPSRIASADEVIGSLLEFLAADIRGALSGCAGVTVLDGKDVESLYPVRTVDDPAGDRNGHIPFTPAYWAALGTMLARHARALLQPPHKVIAVDADNTLWGGVAAEAGAGHVQLDGHWREMQAFLRNRKEHGMLLALVSKNREQEVADVFNRPDMLLRRDDFVAWKVNWKSKSENLRDLAAQLGLGLDSFLFLDDNPLECAEVETHCPAVTVLPLPQPAAVPLFLRHVWAFDVPPATVADADRTEQYRRQAERSQCMAGAGSFRDFLAKLELHVDFIVPGPEHVERAAQLTQRTNQFNATGVRRTAAELSFLLLSGERQGLVTRVRDRFGDYGEVGLCIYSSSGPDLEVENFLLSCRVLGKGIEHRLLAELGRIAMETGKSHVAIAFRRTERNEPVAIFLERAGGAFREGDVYRFPASAAMTVVFDPVEDPQPAAAAPRVTAPAAAPAIRFDELARTLATVTDIQSAIRRRDSRSRPELSTPFVAPRNPVEERLSNIWADVLGFDRVGVHDNFFDLGGDSIRSIQILSRIHEAGLHLTLRQHLDSPCIARQAPLLKAEEPLSADAAAPASSTRFSLARLGQKSLSEVMGLLPKSRP
jgi:FkbH-like protein